MVVTQEIGSKRSRKTKKTRQVIVFNLAELGVSENNWQRVVAQVKARSSVADAFVESGNRPGSDPGKLLVIPQLDRTPAHKRNEVLEDLNESIASDIEYRALHPERRPEATKQSFATA